jgi:hypothetical protein
MALLWFLDLRIPSGQPYNDNGACAWNVTKDFKILVGTSFTYMFLFPLHGFPLVPGSSDRPFNHLQWFWVPETLPRTLKSVRELVLAYSFQVPRSLFDLLPAAQSLPTFLGAWKATTDFKIRAGASCTYMFFFPLHGFPLVPGSPHTFRPAV